MEHKPGSIYVPKQCGLVFEPPALILVYEDSISQKLRRRSMPVRNFNSNSSVDVTAKELKTRHKRYLDSVPQVLVEKMLRIIQEHMGGLDLQAALDLVRPEFEIGENEDLNTLSEDALRRKKEAMEHAFSKTRLRPGDPGFLYDKRVDFPQPAQPSDWDEAQETTELASNVDDDNEFWD